MMKTVYKILLLVFSAALLVMNVISMIRDGFSIYAVCMVFVALVLARYTWNNTIF
ncbi:MAG: hypothetical protein IJJ44_01280 [Solobacterium sp.]|nr:hypothetical protein [Solobacterium sp.]